MRGLLYGDKYKGSSTFNGLYGVYGTYDYFAPEIFRVATTALSVGTTSQWLLTKELALQGSVLGGVGFGTGGSILGR